MVVVQPKSVTPLGFNYPDPSTGNPKLLPFLSEGFFNLLQYRQVVDPGQFELGYAPHPVTVMNWPQNDYFEKNIIDKSAHEVKEALDDARNLSLSVLYWLQTEAPRHDGGELTTEFQKLLRGQGIEIEWPKLRAL